MSEDTEAERKAILARLAVIGKRLQRRQQDEEERRALYVQGERLGITHRSMADVQGITEGAVTLALRKVPGRAQERAAARAKG